MDEAGPRTSSATGGLADQSTFRKTLDTADVPSRDRLSYFRDWMCKTFLACTPETPPDKEIAARIDVVALSQGQAARFNTSLGRLTRTLANVKEIPEEYINLMLVTAGQKQTQYSNSSVFLKGGDLALVEANQIFDSHRYSEGFISQIGLTLHKSTLRTIIGTDFTADCIIANDKKLSPALFNCLDTMNKRLNTGSLRELSALYDACQSLVAAHFAEDRDLLEEASVASISVSQGLVASIKSFVDRNLTDPALSPPIVALKFGISIRHIHQLFRGTGETFSNYVLNRRLERICFDFKTSLKDQSIAEIAYIWGFRDMTTFHRNFKRRYSMTPRQMRQGVT